MNPPGHRVGLHRPLRGMSIVEVLVALAVVVPIVIVAAGVLPFFRLSSTRAWSLNSATDIAREQVERARGTPFDAVSSVFGQNEERNGTLFEWTVDVMPLGGPTPSRKRIVVTVRWQNPEPQRLTLETCLARGGGVSSPTAAGSCPTTDSDRDRHAKSGGGG